MHCVFKALADPTRREILALLSTRDMAAGEIAAHFNLSWPSISHHLSILKQAGLIVCNRSGQSMIYALNTAMFQKITAWIAALVGRPETHCRRRL
mgnify:CR=1 FL=1